MPRPDSVSLLTSCQPEDRDESYLVLYLSKERAGQGHPPRIAGMQSGMQMLRLALSFHDRLGCSWPKYEGSGLTLEAFMPLGLPTRVEESEPLRTAVIVTALRACCSTPQSDLLIHLRWPG